MALEIERLTSIQGNPLAGFFVRNRAGKALAVGAFCDQPWVMPSRKRYARNQQLCEAIGRLTGLPVKWNLSYCSDVVTSHGPQVAKRIYDQRRKDRVRR